MNRELFNDIVELLQNDKYSAQLKEALKKGKETFIIDFGDLNDKSKTVLRTDYGARDDIHGSLHKELKQKLNFRAAELELKERFEDVMIFFRNVDIRKTIRALSSSDINTLMEINGIVTSLIQPRSILTTATFRCPRCGELTSVYQVAMDLEPAEKCSGCNRKRGLVLDEFQSTWTDYQEFHIQENPEEVAAGVIPRTMKVRVIGKQLIDVCKPGDIINIVTTLLTLPGPKKGRVFNWCLEVNNIEVLNKDAFSAELSDEDIWNLINWAKHPQIKKIIVNSIFPSIYGHETEKMGITLALFGGVDHEKPDITIRGTIHVLLVGDPSTAKTRMLIAAKNVAPKGIYTSGKGASGVGLTAAAIQDQYGWRLEAGALVLADRGICCIDEIEKMDDKDRSKVHDAMSIQLIRIDRADKHVTLNARTGIIAAGNPAQGRYDEFSTLNDNISLPSTILSRFDLIFIIKDRPSAEEDRKLIEKILSVATEETELPMMDRDTLKKYILYARRINPTITEETTTMIADFYVEMRKISSDDPNNPIAITARQGEALRRLAEASARMGLKKVVEKEDVELAKELMKEVLRKAAYDPDTERIDIDITETGKPKGKRDKIALVKRELDEAGGAIYIDDLTENLSVYGMRKTEILNILRNALKHVVYQPRGNEDVWRIM